MHIEPAAEPAPGQHEPDTKGWQFAVASGVLGWVLDAFDFFVIVFLFDELMAKFHVGKPAIVASLTLTLAMRPVGALFFGTLADKYGRKKPLIACVLYFSTVTVLSGFAPNYLFFLAMRAMYGIGMGGYWGIGASYAMESAPRRMRGMLSGLMQGGYPFGYLVAAIGMQTIAPRYGWQSMFLIGSGVALLIVLITLKAPESEAWKLHRNPSLKAMFATLWDYRRIFGYMLLLMSVITCLSHGTQDLYPDFLKTIPFVAHAKVLGMAAGLGIPVLYNIAAIVGTLSFGALSEKIGRRYAVMGALALCVVAMPAWAFGGTLIALVVGSCVMQAGVQGAFGVIPAHLNELAPSAVRGLFPGFVYQLGVLVSASTPSVENLLQRHFGYSWALTSFESCVIASLLLIFWFGPENRGRDFRLADEPVAAKAIKA
jgi:SHS family lactate transporter-like MFS transporter